MSFVISFVPFVLKNIQLRGQIWKGITAPIIGASRMHYLEEAVAALQVQLSSEERAELEEPYQPHPVLGHS